MLFQHTLKATLQSNDTKTKKNDFLSITSLIKLLSIGETFLSERIELKVERTSNRRLLFFFANKETHTIVTVIILDQMHQMQLLGVGAQHGYNSWGDHN